MVIVAIWPSSRCLTWLSLRNRWLSKAKGEELWQENGMCALVSPDLALLELKKAVISLVSHFLKRLGR